MKDSIESDWDPLSAAVSSDPLSSYDDMRRRCPVAYSPLHGWSVFRHADVIRVLDDPETFSNAVSTHGSVPNGMDPPEHTAYRSAIDPFFGPQLMRRFEPICRTLAVDALLPIAAGTAFDVMEDFAVPFAVRCQCAFLGWPDELVEPLRDWTRRHQDASSAMDRAMLSAMALELQTMVSELLAARRAEPAVLDDVTSLLMRARVDGAALTDAELTSIFRNWTVGEVGSLAAAIGIVTRELAVNASLHETLRARPELLSTAIDEILRVTGPLVLNKRVATRDVVVGDRRVAAGQRLSLFWVAANRDPDVFDAPGEVRLDRDPADNLLYGRGIHVCPGAPLARLELRVAIEAMLGRCQRIELVEGQPSRRAAFPASGWSFLPVRFT
jgi:cytochrome P450